jgi:NADH-quinone oxidoreductase subunit J
VIGFVILSLVMIASAVFVVTAKKPVYSVVGLLLNFVALAITYLTLHAEFLAVMQIVVYSGAILILFVFVIALLSSGTKPFDVGPNRMPHVLIPAVLFGAIGLVAIIVTIVRSTFAPSVIAGATGDANVFGSVGDFGVALFTHNLLPFEVTAFVLMVAIIGVVLLAGDDTPGRPGKVRRNIAREPINPPREPIGR